MRTKYSRSCRMVSFSFYQRRKLSSNTRKYLISQLLSLWFTIRKLKEGPPWATLITLALTRISKIRPNIFLVMASSQCLIERSRSTRLSSLHKLNAIYTLYPGIVLASLLLKIIWNLKLQFLIMMMLMFTSLDFRKWCHLSPEKFWIHKFGRIKRSYNGLRYSKSTLVRNSLQFNRKP